MDELEKMRFGDFYQLTAPEVEHYQEAGIIWNDELRQGNNLDRPAQLGRAESRRHADRSHRRLHPDADLHRRQLRFAGHRAVSPVPPRLAALLSGIVGAL